MGEGGRARDAGQGLTGWGRTALPSHCPRTHQAHTGSEGGWDVAWRVTPEVWRGWDGGKRADLSSALDAPSPPPSLYPPRPGLPLISDGLTLRLLLPRISLCYLSLPTWPFIRRTLRQSILPLPGPRHATCPTCLSPLLPPGCPGRGARQLLTRGAPAPSGFWVEGRG